MPRIYHSTACLTKHFPSLGSLLQALHAARIGRIELGYCPPLQDFRVPDDLGQFSGTSFLLHNYFPPPPEPFVLNLASADPAVLSRSRALCESAIRLSARFKAPYYSVHCGFLAEFQPASLGRRLEFGALTPYDDGYRIFTESLHQLLAVCDRLAVDLLVEPNVVAPGNLIDGKNRLLMLAEPHEFVRLLGDFKGSRLGVLLDLGHLRVTSQTLHFDWRDFLAAVSSSIKGFHLHDNDGSADQHRPVAAGSWIFDVLRRPAFRNLPIVNEAQFSDVASLVQYNNWLGSHLNDPLVAAS